MIRLASRLGRVLNPIEQSRDILVGIFAFETVVEFQKRFSVAGRAAHVRKNNRAPEFVDEVIVPPEITRTVLRFGAAMDIDDDRSRPGKFRGVRQVEKSGDFFAIERFPANQLRLDKSRCGNAARLACGPARGSCFLPPAVDQV